MKKGIWKIVLLIIIMNCSSVRAEDNNLSVFTDGEKAGEMSIDDCNLEINESEIDSETVFSGETRTVFSDLDVSETEEDVEEYSEIVPLLQNGDMISQYFEGSSVNVFSDDGKWRDFFRARVSYAMQNCDEYVYVDDLSINKLTDIDDVRLIYRSCIKGNRYYVSGSFSYYCDSEKNITKIKIGYYSAYCDSEGKPDKNKIMDSLSIFDAYAGQAVSYAANGRNELEQKLLAHDWIVRECDYDYENVSSGSVPSKAYNAYGCLVEGRAVCNGYALAYSYILEKMGYGSYVIASDKMNHAWNMVNIDSNWFHVDTTWDDPVFKNGTTYHNFNNNDYSDEGFVFHTYFLKNDSEFENLNHYDWRLQNSELTLPESAAEGIFDGALFREINITEYNLVNRHWYYVENGRLCQSEDLWGTNRMFLSDEEMSIDYVHSLDGLLYFTDFKSIYCWNPDREKCSQVLDSGNTITELTVKKGQLIYIVTDGVAFQRCSYKYEPEAPTPENIQIMSVIPYTDRVKLCWEKAENADGYVIYFSDKEDGNFKVLKRLDSNSLTTYSHKFENWAPYYYKIRSFINHNGSKIYSDYSEIAVGKRVPSRVTGIEAYAQESDMLFLFWNFCEGADGYVIYESQDSGNTWKVLKTIKTESLFYQKKGVNPSNIYRIRSFIELNGKKYMGTIPDENCEIKYLHAPDEFSATRVSEHKIKLKWSQVPLADGYVIYRSTNGGAYKAVKTIKDSSIIFYNNSVEAGSNNTYRIRAYKGIQNKRLYGNASES